MNRRGEHPVRRQVGPWDLIATIYGHRGEELDRTGPDRPVPILPEGEPIPELTAWRL